MVRGASTYFWPCRVVASSFPNMSNSEARRSSEMFHYDFKTHTQKKNPACAVLSEILLQDSFCSQHLKKTSFSLECSISDLCDRLHYNTSTQKSFVNLEVYFTSGAGEEKKKKKKSTQRTQLAAV